MTARERSGHPALPLNGIPSAVITACLVAAPLALGIGTGHDLAGASSALGAYLWTVGHFTNRRPIGPRVAAGTAVLFGAAGATGALAGRYLWFLVVMAAVWATFQAVTDTAANALRMPVAMAALCFLLSAIGGGAGFRGALWRGVLVLGGATWMAVCEMTRHPPGRSPGAGSRDLGINDLRAAWSRSRSYAMLLAIPTALAAGVAGLFAISHGAWTATTVLRVLRPEESITLARSGRRIVGTAAGALVAALILAVEPHAVTAVVVLVACVSAMQLVGPARYGFYTFFLTLLALELGSVGEVASWHLALIRVALTLIGAAVAVASGYVYDRINRRRGRTA
ncbi:MAG TPA: FUSC family protein [Acidimicrobiales bacterium]|nr:FUSC family protein [Acidimicrobiales bacterium]